MEEHVTEILDAKKKYFEGDINEYDLKKIVLKLENYYKIHRSVSLSSQKYSLILILTIQRFRNLLLFEKNVVSIFNSECIKLEREVKCIVNKIGRMEEWYIHNNRSCLNNSASTGDLIITNSYVTRSNFSQKISKILRKWLKNNLINPYPSKMEKKMLSDKTGLNLSQIDNWFANARRRILPLMKKGFVDFD